MVAILKFTLPDEEDELRSALSASEMQSCIHEFGQYLRSHRKYTDPQDRPDLLAIEQEWFRVMEGLLE